MSAKPIIEDNVFLGYRGAYKDITYEKMQDEKIKTLAFSDYLTGLQNRVSFLDELKGKVFAAKRNRSKFELLFLDLDNFKYINDTFGHFVGDAFLKKVANILKNIIRPIDVIARLGGDEFTIVLADINSESDGEIVARRIQNVLNDPIVINEHQIYCSASIGIVVYPNDGDDELMLLKNADKAMYTAKSLGKNAYVFYNPEMEHESEERIRTENMLRSALLNNEFVVHYQPLIDCTNGSILGFEALVRINSPEFGMIYPNNFITVAEENGLINQIGEFVFDEACKQINIWKDKGYDKLIMSVNISSVQLQNKNLADRFLYIIEKNNITPNTIELEITENGVIQNEIAAIETLTKLKKVGVRIAIDDFGTGYSSFSYLKRLPIDTVKIDQSFIKGATSDDYSSTIIHAIMIMSKKMNFNVIAEGVETVEQLRLVNSFGCNEIQGFLFSKPVPADEIDKILDKKFIVD
jgi:diguanylate cyclase (GGDEF)-like protein